MDLITIKKKTKKTAALLMSAETRDRMTASAELQEGEEEDEKWEESRALMELFTNQANYF